ncbi:uncharacterized protein LOC105021421 isoform X1 [Esox lucius]|uniref:uncharacterized protein LOC105021421 isoform X1 n=1 Tax=Esox lucius TaxID=8010 RepID=UPI00147737FD|nr:uncharacterized protein LOC105021421 isoform X1 [Esox lucius]XP_019896992.3 uncharacterized protein LOC105021421 isoform X1 [Esox lucius]
MITRNLLLLVSLCLWEGFMGGTAIKNVRRRGVGGTHMLKLEENRVADQWDSSFDSNSMPMVTHRNVIGHDQEGDIVYHPKIPQNNAAMPSHKERQSFKPNPIPDLKEDPVKKGESTLSVSPNNREVVQEKELSKIKNNTKYPGSPTKTGRMEKVFLVHQRPDLHSNTTRFKSLPRSRVRSDLNVHTTGVPGNRHTMDSTRKFNLTSSYGVLKLLSKENLVRIVNSQMRSVPNNFQSKSSRSRKRDLIDVDRSQMEALKLQQDMTVTQNHFALDNQTALPHIRPVTNPNLSPEQAFHTLTEVNPDSDVGKDNTETRGSESTDTWRNKHISHPLSTPVNEVSHNPERDVTISLSDPPSTTLNLPSNVPSQTDAGPPSVFTLQSQGEDNRGGAEDSHKDDLLHTVAPRLTILSPNGTQDTTDGAKETIDSSHVLKLRPDPRWGVVQDKGSSGVMTVESQPGNGAGLVFQEADSDEEEEEGHGPVEGEGIRSRSRRSWIWNQFFVIEEYSGPEPVLIGRLHTDMDRGDGRTKYVLRGEGAGSVFVIDEKTGNIHVTKPLDREEKDEYRLIATATDRQTDRALEPSSTFIIRVQDINDNPPLFEEGPYSATVPEMANIGTSIIQVTATDADDPTYGNSARLVYTLVQGQQFFSVDPQTGILRTAVPDMDRETQDQYLVVLQAKDMGGHLGGLSGTTTVTVRLSDVNDNPPRFTQSMWSFSVSELAVLGAEVGRISATDADLGDNAKLEYTILEGETGDTFNISGTNQEAVITLNKAVDYESRSSYSFSVEVLNPMVDPRFLRRGPFKDRASVRVAVLDADEPPRFSRARYRMDVSENCPPACTVGRVSAVDPDTGLTNNIRFSIDPQSDPEALFRITSDSGLLTTAVELDREREQWHNITVIATQRDNPSQVSRVVVAIETLDLNDNAPELDRQYTAAMCDSSAIGQVVQVLRAIDRDEGGNDSAVYFSIPPESSVALNFSIRDSGGPTATLLLRSSLKPLSRSSLSSLTLHVPLVLRDGTSGLTSTSTVTVSVCPCLRGGARAGEKERQERQTEEDWEWERETLCVPQQSTSPSPGLSTAALLAILACVATLLAVSALSLSLRHQKRDSLSPLEDDDVRENIITYDDEGGGEADTAAFDIAALQSAPHSSRRGYRTLDSRNILVIPYLLSPRRQSQLVQDKARAYSWAQNPGLDPAYTGPGGPGGPLYGRLCYSSHTLPVLRRTPGAQFEPGLAYRFPGGQPDHSLVIQNQGAMVGALEPGAVYIGPAELSSRESREGTGPQSGVSTSDGGTPRTNDSQERGGGGGAMSNCTENSSEQQSRSQDLVDWVHSETLPREREHTLVLTRSGSMAGQGHGGAWVCDSATLPLAGRRASRTGLSPKRGISSGPAEGEPSAVGSGGGVAGVNGPVGPSQQSANRSYASVQQGEATGQRQDYPGSLGRGGLEMGSNFVVSRPDREGGGISLAGTCGGMYPEGLMADWRDRVGMGAYVLGRRDMTPQMLPFPGQARGAYGGIVGYGAGWVPGMEVGRGGPGPGGHSLALRVGEFLRLRLAQVTYDPSQPPYDSVQVYGLEGTGSRAGSLSSLESEGEKDPEKEEWGGGLEEWGPQFQELAKLFRDREKVKEEEKEKDGEVNVDSNREEDEKEEGGKEEQTGGERKD